MIEGLKFSVRLKGVSAIMIQYKHQSHVTNSMYFFYSDQPTDVKTPINANSKAKPCSHFITPYRVTMTKQGKSSENTPISKNANTPLSSCLKLGEKKTKSADQNKKVL